MTLKWAVNNFIVIIEIQYILLLEHMMNTKNIFLESSAITQYVHDNIV